MGRASPAIASFNRGEWAPQMEGRTDEETYGSATHIQQNYIALKQGASTFRSGTAYVQPVKNSANRTWLQRFEFSQTQAFLVEFGDLYVRFYTNHGPLLSTGNAAYNAGTAYVVGNQAVSGGITYYCIAPTTGNAPPNASFWYPMAPYQGSATVAIYEIPSPYAAADLTDSLGEFTLQIQQSGDVLYIAGGAAGAGYQTRTLTRFANAPPNWQFALYAPTDGPYADKVPLIPGSEIALTVSAPFGLGITINAYGGTPFAPTDVGRLVRIGSQFFNVQPWLTNVGIVTGQLCVNNGNNYVALTTATSGASPPVHTAGSVVDGSGTSGVRWLYSDSGYGVAKITAYVSGSQVTADVLSRFPANVVGATAAITGISQANPAVVTAAQAFLIGEALFITGVTGMTQVNQRPFSNALANGANVTLAGIDSTSYPAYVSGGLLIGNASVQWQLGAWSNTTEWPRALDFYKDRLFLGDAHHTAGSVPGLYNSHAPDFFGQQTSDSAMYEPVPGSDPLCWLSAANILLIGTEGGEYGLDAANFSTAPLGPANVEILRQSKWRCRHIAPQLIGTSLLYVQRAGRKVLAMDYNFYLNRYDSTDQSKYAYHITIGGLVGIAYQQEPWSILWGWRTDGTFLSYTFNREDNVTAWCRHNMGNGGKVESMAVIPAPDGLRDEYWAIVKRTVNGQVIRTVEYSAKPFEGPQGGNPGDAQSSAWYVDCGVQSTVPTSTLSGLPPVMWNQTVAIFADGGVQPQQVVSSSGTLTLTKTFTTVTVGFPYQGNLVPMRPEGGADVGTSQGKKKSGPILVLRLVDSLGGQVGQLSNQNFSTELYQNPLGLTAQSVENMEYIRYNDTTTGLDQPPPIQSGDFPVSFPSSQTTDQDDRDLFILVQQNDPCPMTVAGLYPSYDVVEPR